MKTRVLLGLAVVATGSACVRADDPPAQAEQQAAPVEPAPAPAPAPASPRDVSEDLRRILDRSATPGVVAAAIEGGRLVAIGAAGARAKDHPARVGVNDAFHIGSCTKAFTATLCAILVQDGKLRWDLTLAEAFPEMNETMHEGYRGVTLLDLLQHRSGLPAELGPSGIWARIWSHAGPAEKTRAELLPEILKLKPEAAPGKGYLYTNAGYALAGHICERVSASTYEQVLTERVLKPLGIESAGFGAPGSASEINQPRGHRGGIPIAPSKLADNPAGIAPAGTLHMSIGDWAKFAALHLAGARGEPTKLLEAPSFQILHTPPARGENDPPSTPEYAAGWMVVDRPWAGGRALTHSGSNTMWFATVWIAPGRNIAVMAAANAADADAQRVVDQSCAALVNILTPPVGTPVLVDPAGAATEPAR